MEKSLQNSKGKLLLLWNFISNQTFTMYDSRKKKYFQKKKILSELQVFKTVISPPYFLRKLELGQ